MTARLIGWTEIAMGVDFAAVLNVSIDWPDLPLVPARLDRLNGDLEAIWGYSACAPTSGMLAPMTPRAALRLSWSLRVAGWLAIAYGLLVVAGGLLVAWYFDEESRLAQPALLLSLGAVLATAGWYAQRWARRDIRRLQDRERRGFPVLPTSPQE